MSKLYGITRLRSNLKRQTDLTLEALTIIVGPNESFKSTITQSIELGLTGTVTVEGKTYKQTNKLIELAAYPESGLDILCQSPSGTVQYGIRTERGHPKMEPVRPPWTGEYASLTAKESDLLFPMEHVRTVLGADAAKTRETLVKIFAGDTDVASPLGLSPIQKAIWKEGKEAIGYHAEAGSELSALAAWAASQSRSRSTKATGAEKALVQYKDLAQSPGLEILPELEKQHAKAKLYEVFETDRVRKATLEKEIERLELEVEIFATKIQFLKGDKEQEREVRSSEIEGLIQLEKAAEEEMLEAERLLTAVTVMDRAATEGHAKQPGRCIFAHDFPNEGAILEALKTRSATRRKDFDLAVERHLSARDEARKAKEAIDASSRIFDEEIEKLKQQTTATDLTVARAELASITKRLEQLPERWDGQDSFAIGVRIDGLKRAKEAKDRYETGMLEVHKQREEAQAAKRVAELAQDMLGKLLTSIKEVVEREINAYIPTADKAEIDLADGACEIRLTGRDGRTHGQISRSGFQQGILTLALAGAVAARTRLAILKLDDQDLVGFDADNFIWLLEMIERMQIEGKISQAIIVTNRTDLIGRFPRAYQVIKCTDAKANELAGELGREQTREPLDIEANV